MVSLDIFRNLSNNFPSAPSTSPTPPTSSATTAWSPWSSACSACTSSLPPHQTPTERSVLQRQIDATDHKIDRLVYELYELTEDEIKIVEGG